MEKPTSIKNKIIVVHSDPFACRQIATVVRSVSPNAEVIALDAHLQAARLINSNPGKFSAIITNIGKEPIGEKYSKEEIERPGITLIRELQKINAKSGHGLPIMAVSGDPVHESTARDAGADRFFEYSGKDIMHRLTGALRTFLIKD